MNTANTALCVCVCVCVWTAARMRRNAKFYLEISV
jgi:hypothetical protein